jgi:hypothetical protein
MFIYHFCLFAQNRKHLFPIQHPVCSYVGYFFRRLYTYLYLNQYIYIVPVSLEWNSYFSTSMKINNVTTRKYYTTILSKDCMSWIYKLNSCTSWGTTQWSNEKGQKDKQWSIKDTHKTKDRVTSKTNPTFPGSPWWFLFIDLTVYQCMRKMNLNLFYDFSNLVYLYRTVIIYSAFYDTQEGTVCMLMLSRLPHGVPVFCHWLYLISLKTRGSQEPVIAHLVFNLTSKVDRKWGCYT